MTGRFITIEGGEGAGKSTAQTFLADKLAAAGLSAILPELKNYPALFAHVTDLLGRAEFAEDLSGYARHILA